MMLKWKHEPLKVEQMDRLKFRVSGKILPIDRPMSNNNVYTREVCEKIIKDFTEGNGTFGGFMEGDANIPLSQMTHQVTKLWIEGNFVWAEFETFQAESEKPSWILWEALSLATLREPLHINSNIGLTGYVDKYDDEINILRDVRLIAIHLGYDKDIRDVCSKCKGMPSIGHSLSCNLCVKKQLTADWSLDVC